MKPYLASSEYIDWQDEHVLAQAKALAALETDTHDIIRNCFEFVRDEIAHSVDAEHEQVTCKASEVLRHQTGFCYAKSHLLAALLRANNIPAGLCYQRLTIENDVPPFSLHGLNAVYLPHHGWYRLDARGNKQGVSAHFRPPFEQLAFPILIPGEADLPEIWAEPLPIVIETLQNAPNVNAVCANLPDIELVELNQF